MKVWISPYLNEMYLGGKKPIKRWIQYVLCPFHFDRHYKFMRILFLCMRWNTPGGN